MLSDLRGLIKSAEALPPTPSDVAEGEVLSPDWVARQLDAAMLAEKNINRLVPYEKQDLMRENHHNIMMYMNSIGELFNPQSFVETVTWAMKTYRSKGFAVDYWKIMLPKLVCLVKNGSDTEKCERVKVYCQWILHNLDGLAVVTTPEKSV